MLWSDRCLYLSFSMLVMGAVTVIEWDALFPDRWDYATRMPLPIHSRTIFLGKVGALGFISDCVHRIGECGFDGTFPAISYRGAWQGLILTMAAHGISILRRARLRFCFWWRWKACC